MSALLIGCLFPRSRERVAGSFGAFAGELGDFLSSSVMLASAWALFLACAISSTATSARGARVSDLSKGGA